jgi:hypothetical protein
MDYGLVPSYSISQYPQERLFLRFAFKNQEQKEKVIQFQYTLTLKTFQQC